LISSAALAGRARWCREEALWLAPVTLMAAALLATAQGVGMFFGLSPWSMISLYGHKVLKMLPTLMALGLVAQLVLAIREDSDAPLAAFTRSVRRMLADPWLVAARVAPLLLMPVVFVGFSSLKMLMPRLVPFYLDDAFAAMDRILFLGHQPWELTHFLFGSAPASLFIDRLYTFWVLLLSIAVVGFALFAPRGDRARFFLAFTLAWLLLGVVGAWLLASAGPCYSALVGAASAPEFAELVQKLSHMSQASQGRLNAPGWQEVLWRSHVLESYSFGMGVSAMPSLHNAIATLYALAAFRVGRTLGWFMTGYAVLIFIGSIHLGWHYAVDGIVGAAAMVLIWRWVDAWCRRSGYDAAVATSSGIAVPEAAARP
jgi:hypothetical protein